MEKEISTCVSIGPRGDLVMAFLKLCTACSVSSFHGWYEAVVPCQVALHQVNSWKSMLVKTNHLSVMNISGRPCIAKMVRILTTVVSEVVH